MCPHHDVPLISVREGKLKQSSLQSYKRDFTVPSWWFLMRYKIIMEN